MFAYIVRRFAVAIPTILILIVLSFVLMYSAPGNPFNGETIRCPRRFWPTFEAKYGLDQPYWKQIINYVWNVVAHFDFGPSFKYKDRSVNDMIAQGFPVTLTYGFWSFVVAVVVGVSLGVLAAIRHNTWIDYLAVGFSIGAQVAAQLRDGPDAGAGVHALARLAARRRLERRAMAVHRCCRWWRWQPPTSPPSRGSPARRCWK